MDPTAPLANGPMACPAMGLTVHWDADRKAPLAAGLVVAVREGHADPPEHAAAGPQVHPEWVPLAHQAGDFVENWFV